jgi:DNA-directed RNA polymerase III subunit RPC8
VPILLFEAFKLACISSAMFCVEVITDTIKVQAADLQAGASTLTTIHNEIDMIYPNRVLMDVGLVIARYEVVDRGIGDDAATTSQSTSTQPKANNPQTKSQNQRFITKLGHGSCQGSCAHFRVTFALIVFRPFVGEVLVGTIADASEDGIMVSLGFFSAIFIPVYWMLNPSVYENGVWVWIPSYDDDDMDEGTAAEQQRYEMNIGAKIRFRVKSINFTQVTATAKGMQAVTSSTVSSNNNLFRSTSSGSGVGGGGNASGDLDDKSGGDGLQQPLRRRSSSVGLDESASVPSAMHIVASICEDGLGLTSWWTTTDDE